MPSGLDGNPRPVVTVERTAVINQVADDINALEGPRVLVGVDGRSGTGKSTFADELASTLRLRGRHVVRSTTDSFHRPRADRFRLGPTSAEGYYRDSHQIDRIVGDLLAPFRDGAESVLVAAFDEPADRDAPEIHAVPPRAVLVFDGLFVHRSDLVAHWDLGIVLIADHRLDRDWLVYLEGGLPDDPSQRAVEVDRRLRRARWPRYRDGWARYLEEADLSQAIHVDNESFEHPRVLRG